MREITQKCMIQLTFCVLLYSHLISKVNSNQLDESQVSRWAASFKQELDSHIENVLGYTKVQTMLKQHEKDLGKVPINGTEVFTKIYQNVNIRYSDLVLATKKIKSVVESKRKKRQSGGNVPPGAPSAPLGSNSGAPPPLSPGNGGMPSPGVPLLKCCGSLGPVKYDGRYRDDVTLKECYGNLDDVLKSIAQKDLKSTFETNSATYPSVTWQYFADAAGHFVQFPANDRSCDKSSPKINSPLVKEWFVEKLHMERKNLVILMDNGAVTNKGWSGPQTRKYLLTDAVRRILTTLTPRDKVNIVAFPSNTEEVGLPGGCQDKLFIASQSNVDILTDYIQNLPDSTGESNLTAGLQKVYQLFAAEKKEFETGFKSRSNMMLVLLDGQSSLLPVEKTTLLTLIAKEQLKMNKTIQHFIYTLGKPSSDELIGRLAQVADQNNMKLNKSSVIDVEAWPMIPQLVFKDEPVGKEGFLEIVTDLSKFPIRAANYFQHLPPQVDLQLSTIVPVLDRTAGVSMTVATPVYDNYDNKTVFVAAVDASLAAVFSDIVNFNTGENSYTYLVDITHGHVLLHPKLRDPAETHHPDTMFPRLELLEPDLKEEQRKAILSSSGLVRQFDVQHLRNIRQTVTGELVKQSGNQHHSATVYHQVVVGTSLCVVLVHFAADVEEARLQKPQEKVPLHAPYHRIDKLVPAPVNNKPDKDAVCHLEQHFVSFKESVIKLAPSVFRQPETYKYTRETFDTIRDLNTFLIADKDTNLIRDDMKVLIQQTIRATDKLDELWTSNAKDIIERFYGSTSGVFRVFPGVPLQNTFDHMHTDWYKRSIASPDVTMYHYGKLSFINRKDVIIVSRALVETGRLQGVVGMTITPRLLTSQLVKTSKDCNGIDRQCHILDTSGNIIDSLEDSSNRHLNKLYPWLTSKLVKDKKMKMEWCTGFSDGYHKLTFTLTQSVTSDPANHDPCLQFSLQNIRQTNLLLLVLGNRTSLKCDDTKYEMCSSCQHSVYNPMYQLSIPRCQRCLSNLTSQCQCRCYCDTDIDTCQQQFMTKQANFPLDACYYAPVSTSQQELLPGSPGPIHQLQRCPIPCVAIEDLDICTGLSHCKLSSDIYPTCVWRSDDELTNVNVSRFFPTTTPPQPPSPPQIHTQVTKGLSSTGTGSPPFTTSTRSPIRPTSTDQTKPQSSPQPATLASTDRSQAPGSQPGFVSSTPVSSSVGPVVTASHIHPISGAPSTSAVLVGSTVAANQEPQNGSDEHLSGGAIAAIVLSVVAVLAFSLFVILKLYGKKFRPGADDSSSKYRSGSGLFDSTLFLKSNDQVTLGTAPSSTVPYQEMQVS